MTITLSPLVFIIVALILGFKHAYDPDHLVAVSNFITRSSGPRHIAQMTVSWAVGHMLTAAIITILLFSLSLAEVVTTLLSQIELGVAIVLILIGVVGIFFKVPTVHEHPHRHLGKGSHSHVHRHRFGGFGGLARRVHFHHPLFGVGIVHGLASNDEILSLFVIGLGVGSLEMLLGGVTIFTLGVVLGMTVFGLAVAYPLSRDAMRRVQFVINLSAGSLSILYGLMIIAGFHHFNFFFLAS